MKFPRIKNIVPNAVCIFFISFLIACSTNSSYKSNNQKESKPYALTTFTILADIAKNIAGDRIYVESITKPGTEIHTYQFTPSDLIKVKKADLIFENGLGLESWINKFMTSAGNIPRFTLSNGLEPLEIASDAYAGKPNPHAWMSPKRTIKYVDNIVNAFVQIDPEGQEFYLQQAYKYKQELMKLDEQLRVHLSSLPSESRFLVTCEGAFSYLAYDYGMKEAYLWPVNSENQVTPRRMANLISKVKDNQIKTIFCETTVSAKAQKEVARASGAAFGGNFFVDSLSGPNGPAPTLLELYGYNLDLIKEGLSIK